MANYLHPRDTADIEKGGINRGRTQTGAEKSKKPAGLAALMETKVKGFFTTETLRARRRAGLAADGRGKNQRAVVWPKGLTTLDTDCTDKHG